jgi:ribonucleoside-triphosphate reductase
MKIIKRNGEINQFDKERIKNAILKAMKYGSGIVKEDVAIDIADSLEKYFSDHYYKNESDIPSVKIVETTVYYELVKRNEIQIAKAYESFRAVQEFKREVNTTDESILKLINTTNEEVMRENSNKNAFIVSTQRDLIAGEISKDIAFRKLIPAHIVQAHIDGDIHWHDADYTLQHMHNCDLVNLEDMLQNGTVINEKLVEKPKSFETACTVATQIMAQVASSQYGGQSITIKHLAPFLRTTYEKYLKKYTEMGFDKETAEKLATDRKLESLKNGVQTIRYQLSTISGTNGQAPFATIYLEVEVGSEYEEEEALIVEEMIKQRLEGMKNYKGQEIGEAFPKLVYPLDEHNCLEGGKYDYLTKLAAKCNVKRLVPDYQSVKIMKQNYDGDNFPPMGCRSHLSPWKDENGNNKWYGRFNQGVVSLNLARIGIQANGDMDSMWKILDEKLSLAYEALMVRHDLLKGTVSDVAPILWQHGAIARLKKGEKIDKLLYGGYSTISLGYVGLHEMIYALIGKSHTTPEGQELSLKVMNKMKESVDKWGAETNIGFSLYGTPAESLIARFCKLDREKFGVIKGVTDKEYYTNSYHVNVTEPIDAFSKLKFEAQYHSISSGGCISYVEVPDMSKNVEAVEKIINFIYHNVQYAEINTKSDICYKCGYDGEMQVTDDLHWYCPNCGNDDEYEMQVMRRTCGYIGTNLWNRGRTKEIKERVLHL